MSHYTKEIAKIIAEERARAKEEWIRQKEELRIDAYAKHFEEMSYKERMARLGELNKQMLECCEKRGVLKDYINGDNSEFNRNTLMNAGKLGILGVILGMSSVLEGSMIEQLSVGASMGTMWGCIGISTTLAEALIKSYINNKKMLNITEECQGYVRAFSNNPEKYYKDFETGCDENLKTKSNEPEKYTFTNSPDEMER